MTKPLMRAFIASLVLIAAGLASAQVDDRARALLEGMAQQVEAEEIRTLDQTMVMVMYNAGDEITSRTRMVVDYGGQRAAIVSEVMGQSTTMVHKDGRTTMTVMGMTMPVPEGMGNAFDGVFETGATGDLLADPDATATYDGQVSYGDVLSGQQVTYTGDFGVPGMQIQSTTLKFVFDDAGALLGQVVEAEGMELVSVYVGEPKVAGALFYDIDMYEMRGDSAELFATMRYEEITVNEPVDESLF